ncbi:g10616 [Coccomyxa viridis]|uniref:G10616 protein n=1 Tax=Coccomyxa viridis TaxID=1274662 RepID=A0ABP1GAC5_9CHLO
MGHRQLLLRSTEKRLPYRYERSRLQDVSCMAHPRRVAKVAKQIEREVGTLLLHDRVLQGAVCPEVKMGLDDAVSAIASVTEVAMSNDLQVAKVYISVYSDPHGRDIAMKGLSRLEGYVRKHIAGAINMRSTPEIRFIHDDSIQRGEEVMAILDRIKRQDAGEIEPPAIALAGEVGANPASEDFLEQSARASRQSAAGTDDAAAEVEGGEADLEDFEEETEGFLDEKDVEGFLDDEEIEEDDGEDDDDEDEVSDARLPLIHDSDLDFMPNVDGEFAPTVREPWRSERELKRVKGRAKKGGRKTTRRKR